MLVFLCKVASRPQTELTGALLEHHAAHELEESVGVEARPVDRHGVLRENNGTISARTQGLNQVI